MENIKKIMIILVIIILLIAIILLIISKNKQNINPEYYEVGPEQDISHNVFNDMEKLNNHRMYYTISNITKKYINSIKVLNGDGYIDKSRLNTSLEEEKKSLNKYEYKKISSMLDERYYDIMNITENDIIRKISKFKVYGDYNHENVVYDIIIDNIYTYEMTMDIELYFVNFSVNNIQDKIIIKLDNKNKTFSIFLEDYMDKFEYSKDMSKDNIEIPDTEIEINNYNKFTYAQVEDATIVKGYVDLYKTLAINNTVKAYEYLDEEYKQKRFGSFENYKKYVQENTNEINQIQPTEYLINRYDDYTEYVAKDSNGNMYIFKETSVGEFTLILDTYTLEYEKFNTEYKRATNKDKVIMNIDKFFQMLNAKDYKSAYNLLDTNFKNNNFRTEGSFEKYMKSKLYSYNDVSYVKFSDEISGVYTYYIEISNRQNEINKKIKMNIIMQLLEGTNYKLSFEIL